MAAKVQTAKMQSEKLSREEGSKVERDDHLLAPTYKNDPVIEILPLEMYNEWVAIVPFAIQSSLEVPLDASFRNVGVVIGTSQTTMAPNGQLVQSRLTIGSVVLFQKRSVVAEMRIDQVPYKGKRIVLLSERNIVCRLPGVPVKIITDGAYIDFANITEPEPKPSPAR